MCIDQIFPLVFILLFGLSTVACLYTNNTMVNMLAQGRVTKKLYRDRMKLYQEFTHNVETQYRITKKQRIAMSMITQGDLISQNSLDKAMFKNGQQLQNLANTLKDSYLIQNTTRLLMGINYQRTTEVIKVASSSIYSSTQFNTSIDYTQNNTMNFNSTQTTSSWNLANERTTMCTGDHFGLYIEPISSVLYSWGLDTLGRVVQVGNSTYQQPAPIALSLNSGEYVKQLACGSQHALVLTNQAIYGWGSNSLGQVGDGTTTTVKYPKRILTHSDDIKFINANFFTSVYINSKGIAFTWGRGGQYQLGNGNNLDSTVPISLNYTGIAFTKICFGTYHAIGQSVDGSMYYWGLRYADNVERYSIPSDSTKPTKFTSSFFSITKIVDFQCGNFTTIALTYDGRVFGWGYNMNGVLGYHQYPSTVEPIQAATDLVTSDSVVKIFHQYDSVFIITSSMRVYAWGRNDQKICQLGTNITNTVYSCGTYCQYTECGDAIVPTEVHLDISVDNIYDIRMTRDSTIILYSKQRSYGILASGMFGQYFGGPTDRQNYFLKVKDFNMFFIAPQERKFPIFRNATHFVLYSENQLSQMEMLLINLRNTMVNQTVISAGNSLAAKSFFNTHDLTIEKDTFYFGGFVNMVISDRIIKKSSAYSVFVFNETLPYPVASGILQLVDDFVYIFGGLTLNSTGQVCETSKIMRSRLTDLLIWEEFSPGLPLPVYGGVSFIENEIVYLFGGQSEFSGRYSDILYASVYEMEFKNSYNLIPYAYVDNTLISSSNKLFLLGKYLDFDIALQFSMSAAQKTNPLYWVGYSTESPSLYEINNGNRLHAFINNDTFYFVSKQFSTVAKESYSTFLMWFGTYYGKYLSVMDKLDGAFIYGSSGLKSCKEYYLKFGKLISNDYYWIKFDNGNKAKVFCLMNAAGGGWTLILKSATSSKYLYSHSVWYDSSNANTGNFVWTDDLDYVSPAFYSLKGSESMLSMSNTDSYNSWSHSLDTAVNLVNGPTPVATASSKGKCQAKTNCGLAPINSMPLGIAGSYTSNSYNRFGYVNVQNSWGSSIRVGFSGDNDSSDSNDSFAGIGLSCVTNCIIGSTTIQGKPHNSGSGFYMYRGWTPGMDVYDRAVRAWLWIR